MNFILYFILMLATNKSNESKHVVIKGETIYNISKRYGMEISELKKLNHIKDTLYRIRIGDTLKVIINNTPIEKRENTTVNESKPKTESTLMTKSDTLFHIVKEGETIYSIAPKYPHLTFQELLKMNNLSGSVPIHKGQKLNVGKAPKGTSAPKIINQPKVEYASKTENLPPAENSKSISELYKEIVKKPDTIVKESISIKEGQKVEPVKNEVVIEKPKETVKKTDVIKLPIAKEKIVEATESPSIAKVNNNEKSTDNAKIEIKDSFKSEDISESKAGMMEKFEIENGGNSTKCIAMIIPGSNLNCALFSAARDGAIIRVRNVKNNKAVYLKVIGKLPKIATEKEVCIKISDSAAQKLGTDNVKFLVEIEY